ncbi:MAG TPA: DUF4837 family protein [Candidatus Marinimicrobia bacterium]|jgi:hypothetical protein|nr:DUF4837 family protein [Candidatus Neomarinimicrobiota bacterium]MDP7094645.1 DUF4837 family protein [Candidatus Neomarinimicrobiota bacterium]MDP7512348.1 DUF4837 family protein [Candidatus Neomarinimicrobiota bacterium]HJL63230.1 DUF4837 family protein [Candidatus Neomarinimicrobiota bacterium]HJM11686.1 DUF4837 family protein [Candidatus Neomarinimicrobiota bacterium]|tara:strand:+ start:2997 stop:4001 length:1005 start_codon:yes stop_codon:yes gene_type:complete
MKRILYLIGAALLLLMIGCGKPLSKGADDELIVLAAKEDKTAARTILTRIFSDTLYTPAPEPYYKAKFVKPSDLENVRHHPNLIAISINDDLTNPGTRLVKSILPEESFTNSKNNNPFILTNEPYAKLQTMLVINGNSPESIVSAAEIQGLKIYEKFDEQFIERQSRFLFKRARKEELEQNLFNKHGFSLQIPWGYTVVQDSVETNIFWIGREEPFRWLVFHWEDGMVIQNMNDAEQFSREIPQRIFGHIQYTDYKFNIKPTMFNVWSGWRITGLWESLDESQGGPFIAYTFYDGITDRTYYIHALIFNPGEDKYLLLRQLDIIAHTFYVEDSS